MAGRGGARVVCKWRASASARDFPKEGWLRVAEALPDKRSGFTAQEDLPAVGPGAELMFLHDWSISRIPVASVEGRVLKTAGPIGFPAQHYVIDHFEPHPRYCLENDPSFLTETGTWCHDPARQELIYLPRDGETPAGTVDGRARSRRNCCGWRELRKAAEEREDRGRHFRVVPLGNAREGLCRRPGDQACSARTRRRRKGDPHGQWRFVPWAVEVERAEAVVFSKCTFRNLGGGGVLLGSAAKSCALENCHITDISGNGIGIGEGAERRIGGKPWWQTAPEDTATGNRVENCLVERCGVRFYGAVGIWVGLAKDSRDLATTKSANLPYTGISVGWMWNPSPTPCGGNI